MGTTVENLGVTTLALAFLTQIPGGGCKMRSEGRKGPIFLKQPSPHLPYCPDFPGASCEAPSADPPTAYPTRTSPGPRSCAIVGWSSPCLRPCNSANPTNPEVPTTSSHHVLRMPRLLSFSPHCSESTLHISFFALQAQ